MAMEGGYDTGVWFVFTGKSLSRLDRDNPIVGGRIARDYGFCSEGLVQTRHEVFYRGGRSEGIALFFQRCEDRKVMLQRWMDDYYARHVTEKMV